MSFDCAEPIAVRDNVNRHIANVCDLSMTRPMPSSLPSRVFTAMEMVEVMLGMYFLWSPTERTVLIQNPKGGGGPTT